MKKIYFIFLVLFAAACSENEPFLEQELESLSGTIPENWTVGIETESFVSGTTISTNPLPDVVVIFVNTEETYTNTEIPAERSPNLILNYYKASRKDEVNDLLSRTTFQDLCIPFLYDSTANYYIISSPCLINHGYQSEESIRLTSTLETVLHNFFASLR